ncbi:hypothetical protein EJP77_16605 [Paenibacillus zeisoli]|uniref:Uncharacterized protein n=1 Tax=Paenibacillus zeisoli TaxID=2496267 RepID=A0A3S1JLX7_9BACL|nr:fibronectin type III domain-containing protein [Paenibacillus zeisoli]RUT29021.1 hypothetical protein EJP77_16605 [Paenibacillus zeisoli]
MRAGDAAGNWSAQSSAVNVKTLADSTLPSVPTGLNATGITNSGFTLKWDASSDNVGVTQYEVFRDGVSLGTVTGTSMNVTGLSSATDYSMTVRAGDAAGNWSAQSSGYTVTTTAGAASPDPSGPSDPADPTDPSDPGIPSTPVDSSGPSIPTGLNASSITDTGFTLSWGASTDDVGVTQYEVYQDGVSLGTVTGTSMNVTGLTPSTDYNMTVQAGDAAGNWSLPSSGYTVTTTGGAASPDPSDPSTPDTPSDPTDPGTPDGPSDPGIPSPPVDSSGPSIPTGLNATGITDTGFTLSWDASTDDVGVTQYEVFRDGVSLGTVTGTSMNVTGLTPATDYNMTVQAGDAAGNWSLPSSGYTVTTTGGAASPDPSDPSTPDTPSDPTDPGTPDGPSDPGIPSPPVDSSGPSIPTGLNATGITDTGFTLSWDASTDDVGVTQYEVFRDGVSLGTVTGTSMNVTGLTPATDYNMTVQAGDAAGNWSLPSSGYTVTTTGGAASPDPSDPSTPDTPSDPTDPGTSDGPSDPANPGTPSDPADPSTPSDPSPSVDSSGPSIPTGLNASDIIDTGFALSWNASTDDVGVTQYEVFRDGVSLGMVAGTSMNVTGLTPATDYNMTVQAGDAAGNWSLPSSGYMVTTPAGVASPDPTDPGTPNNPSDPTDPSTPGVPSDPANPGTPSDPADPSTPSDPSPSVDSSGPSIPTGLNATGITDTGFILSWDASTDDVGVTQYEVYRDGMSLGTVTGTSMNVTGLSSSTDYNMTVQAGDAAGNWSLPSSGYMVTTTAGAASPDPTDPSTPDTPSDPTDPSTPGAPSDPANPGNPGVPTDPTDPGTPAIPGDSTAPSDPSTPGNTSDPSDPADPGTPGVPSDPTDASTPGTPSSPSDPGAPGIPSHSSGSSGSSIPNCNVYRDANRIIIDGCLNQSRRAVEVTLGTNVLDDQLDKLLADEGYNQIIFDIVLKADEYIIHIPWSLVRHYSIRQKINFEIKMTDQRYQIPWGTISESQINRKLGADSANLNLTYHIRNTNDQENEAISSERRAKGFTMVQPFTQFSIYTDIQQKRIFYRFETSKRVLRLASPTVGDQFVQTTGAVLTSKGHLSYAPWRRTAPGSGTYQLFILRNNSISGMIQYTKTFNDIRTSWGRSDIEDMASKLIVIGESENIFSPNNPVTRAEFAALLVRIFGLVDEASPEQQFQDVSSGEWYYEEIQSAALSGIIEGYGKGIFKPNQSISREEMSAMIARVIEGQFPEITLDSSLSGLERFKDADQIMDSFTTSAAGLVNAQLIQGYPNGEFHPRADASRAEAVTLIRRLLQYIGFL